MANFFAQSLQRKFLAILAATGALVSAGILFGLLTLSSMLNEYGQTTEQQFNAMEKISALNVRFKTQVQEWKNVLIRGWDDDQRNKYWKRFNDNAVGIEQDYQEILASVQSDEVRAEIEAFASFYPIMVSKYREGYQAFVDADYAAPVADKFVKGVDRAPTAHLNKASQLITEQTRALNASMSAASTESRLLATGIVIVSMALCAAMFLSFIYRQVLKPLNEAAEASAIIAKGDFTHELVTDRQDQIGHLYANINQIKADLGQLISEIVTNMGSLTAFTDSLMKELAKVSQNMEVQHQHSASSEQDVTQLAGLSKNVQDASNKASGFVDNASEAIVQRNAEFNSTKEDSELAVASMQTTVDIIAQLQQNADEITTVTRFIGDIAEKTNLLALNAAIEAARAGEHGRGFSVVADEIRKLATQTQESTETISQTVKKLTDLSGQATESVISTQGRTNQTVDSLGNVLEFISNIQSTFDQMRELNSQIDAYSSEQTSATDSVSQGLETIVDRSNSSLRANTRLVESAETIHRVVESLEALTAGFKINGMAETTKTLTEPKALFAGNKTSTIGKAA